MTEKNSIDKGFDSDLTSDITLARSVQQLLFPRSSPVCDWCCIGVKNYMTAGLGGDYFDFIRMPDGCQTLFIGDVTGHGLHASVVMSLVYGYIHRATLDKCDPLDVVTGINNFLRCFARRSEEFDYLFSTTLFFAIIDPVSLRMHYINCGHVSPLLLRDNQIIQLEPTASPLGFFDEPDIEQKTFEFSDKDRLLLYTDGISEAVNASGEQYGAARVEAALRELDGDHLEFLDLVYTRMMDFGCVVPPQDDCTAIILDFHKLPSGAVT